MAEAGIKIRGRWVAGALFTLSASFGAPAQVPAARPAPDATAAAESQATRGVQPGPPASTPASPDEAAYLIGINLGQQLHAYGVTHEISVEKIVAGLQEGLAGKNLSPADHRRIQAFLQSEIESLSARNADAAQEFLDRNRREKGVRTTPSGLQYKVIKDGNSKAEPPRPTDQVTVQYRGQLLDGTEFANSSEHAPATFAMTGVIKGWQEALALMKPGAKWQLFIPPALAYGPDSRPGIPGGSLLIFDIELQSAEPAPPEATASIPAAAARRNAKSN